MKRLSIVGALIGAAILGILVLKYSPGTSALLWGMSAQGTWLLPLILASSLLDSVHPCSFSILLITIAFLLSLRLARRRILEIGGTYIAGIFLAYLLIGLGILKVLHIFSVPHFMGKLGAGLLVAFGILNLLGYFFPNFPIKLKVPSVSHRAMGMLMDRASLPAALGLGVLVGICQFPCMGGPYLMVIGLLHDQVTYTLGFWYLALYNTILTLPLVAVLFAAADTQLLEKVSQWKRTNLQDVRLIAGALMFIIGILIFFL